MISRSRIKKRIRRNRGRIKMWSRTNSSRGRSSMSSTRNRDMARINNRTHMH
jgi:hypothetical protein